MIQKFLNASNAPVDNRHLLLSVGDALMVYVDLNEIDIDQAAKFVDHLAEIFPRNSILLTPKGIEYGVIKYEDYQTF